MLTAIYERDCVDGWLLGGDGAHTCQAGGGDGERGATLSKILGDVWPVGVGCASQAEVSESLQLNWIHGFALEDKAAEVCLMVEIFESVGSDDFLIKVLVGVVEPLEIFTLNLEREGFVLLNRPVLDLIQLIQLPLKNVVVAALLSVQIDIHLLIFFECVNNFVELWLAQEQRVVLQDDAALDLVCWHAKRLLVKVLLKGLLAIRFKPKEKALCKYHFIAIHGLRLTL